MPRFTSQQDSYLLGTASEPITLTASFDDNLEILHVANKTQVVLYIEYTVNAASSNRILYVQTETGPDNTDFYKTVTSQLSNGEETWNINTGKFVGATGGATYKIRVLLPVADDSVRISVRESGSADFGTVTIRTLRSS